MPALLKHIPVLIERVGYLMSVRAFIRTASATKFMTASILERVHSSYHYPYRARPIRYTHINRLCIHKITADAISTSRYEAKSYAQTQRPKQNIARGKEGRKRGKHTNGATQYEGKEDELLQRTR